MAEPPAPDPVRPPVDWRYRIFVAAMLAIAGTALFLGVRATDTDGEGSATVDARPDVVERVVPRNGAHVPRQTEIGIDLKSGYEGALIVNGVSIPTEEMRLVPEQNQVFFTPGEGKILEQLPPGRTCVTAIAWRSADGRGTNDLRFQWCFDVT